MRRDILLILAILLLIFGCSQSKCNSNSECSNSEQCLSNKCVLKTNIPVNFSNGNYTYCPVDNCMVFLCKNSQLSSGINNCTIVDQKQAFNLYSQSWQQQKFMLGAGPTFLDFGEFAEAGEYQNILPASKNTISLQCTGGGVSNSCLLPGVLNNSKSNLCYSSSECCSSGSPSFCRNKIPLGYLCLTKNNEYVECDCAISNYTSVCGSTFIQNCRGKLGKVNGINNAVINPGICQYYNATGHIQIITRNLGFCESSTNLKLAVQIVTENNVQRFPNDINYMGVKEFARFSNDVLQPETYKDTEELQALSDQILKAKSIVGEKEYASALNKSKSNNPIIDFKNKEYNWFAYQAQALLQRGIIPLFVTESSDASNPNKGISDSALTSLAIDMNNVAAYATLNESADLGQNGPVIITVNNGNQASLVKKLCKNCLIALMIPNYDDVQKCSGSNLGQQGNRWGSDWSRCSVNYVVSEVAEHELDIDFIGQRMLFDREAWSAYKSAYDCVSDPAGVQTIFNNKIVQSKEILEKTNKASILIYFGGRRTDYPGGDNCWSEDRVDNLIQYTFQNIPNLTTVGYIGLANLYYDDEILGKNLPAIENISKISYWSQINGGQGSTGLCAILSNYNSRSSAVVKCPISMTVENWIKDDPSSSNILTYNEGDTTRVKDGYGINGYWQLLEGNWVYKNKDRKNMWFNQCNAYSQQGELYLGLAEVPKDTYLPQCNPTSTVPRPTDCWFKHNGKRYTYSKVPTSTGGNTIIFPRYGKQLYGCSANFGETACLTQQ